MSYHLKNRIFHLRHALTTLDDFSLLLGAENLEPLDENHHVVALGLAGRVVFLGRLDDEIDDIGEATAAAAALLHGVIDLARNDQLPTVFIEKRHDRFLDVLVGDQVAGANHHGGHVQAEFQYRPPFNQKATASVKITIVAGAK